MPEETKPTEKVEINESVIREGTVEFMNKKGFSNPTPQRVKSAVKALQAFCISMVALVGATDLFSGRQVKVLVFVFSVAALFFEFISKATGVEEEKK
jgi:hypothetical protein